MKKEAYSLVNPILRRLLCSSSVERRLHKLCSELVVRYLDLGGAHSVEGYVVIHLSVVEPYGIPLRRTWDYVSEFDESTFSSVTRKVSLKRAVSLNFDVSARLPLPDGCLSGVNMSHFLEHFDPASGLAILKEVHRVLQADGVIRVGCPDLRKYAQAYVQGNRAFFEDPAIRFHYQYPQLQSMGDLFISKAYDGNNGHRWFYDADSCCDVLQRAGFVQCGSRRMHESALPRIEEVEPPSREHESFYVEAMKPRNY
jgi:predicted SAM-dependent methyltransferase